MKNVVIVIGFLSCIASCDIRNTKDKPDVNTSIANVNTNDSTSVQLIDSIFNFGKISDGEMVEYSYRFRNTGAKPLIIANAIASCGCTVPEKPEEPVKPGETGFLKVVFNSKGRVGQVHKEITVTSNAKPSFPALQLVGEVESSSK